MGQQETVVLVRNSINHLPSTNGLVSDDVGTSGFDTAYIGNENLYSTGFMNPNSATFGNYCVPPPSGYYVPNVGMTSVIKCPVGSVTMENPTTGASTCEVCQVGSVANEQQSECISCPAGTYNNIKGAKECIPCAVGSYSRIGQAICTKCAFGTYTDEIGTENGCRMCYASEH